MIKNKNLPRSAQIAVGTERGFLTASADYLILADSDEFVQLYNVINIGLLKAATNIEIYRQLRFATSLNVWQQHQVKFNSKLAADVLFDFWHQGLKKPSLAAFNFPPSERKKFLNPLSTSKFEPIPFDKDYVWNKDRFLKLQKMAKLDHIFVYNINFTKADEVDDLQKAIKKYSLNIVSLDLSNIHEYVGLEGGLLTTMKKFHESYIVVSHILKNQGWAVPRFLSGPYWKAFRYFVFYPNAQYQFMFDNYVNRNLPAMNGDFVILVNDRKILWNCRFW